MELFVYRMTSKCLQAELNSTAVAGHRLLVIDFWPPDFMMNHPFTLSPQNVLSIFENTSIMSRPKIEKINNRHNKNEIFKLELMDGKIQRGFQSKILLVVAHFERVSKKF